MSDVLHEATKRNCIKSIPYDRALKNTLPQKLLDESKEISRAWTVTTPQWIINNDTERGGNGHNSNCGSTGDGALYGDPRKETSTANWAVMIALDE